MKTPFLHLYLCLTLKPDIDLFCAMDLIILMFHKTYLYIYNFSRRYYFIIIVCKEDVMTMVLQFYFI